MAGAFETNSHFSDLTLLQYHLRAENPVLNYVCWDGQCLNKPIHHTIMGQDLDGLVSWVCTG